MKKPLLNLEQLKELKLLLETTSKDETRMWLEKAYLYIEDNKLMAISADGHCLTKKVLSYDLDHCGLSDVDKESYCLILDRKDKQTLGGIISAWKGHNRVPENDYHFLLRKGDKARAMSLIKVSTVAQKPSFEIAFDKKILKRLMAATSGDKFKLNVSDSLKPIEIDVKHSADKLILMPLKWS